MFFIGQYATGDDMILLGMYRVDTMPGSLLSTVMDTVVEVFFVKKKR